MKTTKRFIPYLLSAAVGLLLSSGAIADSHISTASNPTWKAECGSCHVAYPPSLLPADSWRALMSGLDKHFGVDASVDAKSAAEIGAFLQKNAGRNRGASTKPMLRITETSWFKHEHDEVGAAVWKNPKVKSASNCAACHSGAEQGNFSEHGVRIPR
jgi:hypothetical protein